MNHAGIEFINITALGWPKSKSLIHVGVLFKVLIYIKYNDMAEEFS